MLQSDLGVGREWIRSRNKIGLADKIDVSMLDLDCDWM